jgi:GNAT superfamily N-acetyltransferase
MGTVISIDVSGGHISGRVLSNTDYEEASFVQLPYKTIASIDLVVVGEHYRRRGRGSSLVRRFIGRAKAAGAQSIIAELVQIRGSISVFERMAFFEKIGFQVFPIPEDEHDTPPLVMVAKL